MVLSTTARLWRDGLLRVAAHAACAAPLALLAHDALRGHLGPDPIAQLTHATGEWALRLLLLCLAMTPLRLALGQTWPVRYRRMLGLWAFAYASAHLGVYVVLDLGAYWSQLWSDVLRRPFITVGFAAWLLLVPLAITSTPGWMRRLGRRWGQLHRAVYVIAVLAVVHWWWLVKSDLREPMVHAAILALLLASRPLLRRWRAGGGTQPRGA